MKHRLYGKKLGRTEHQRQAMFRSQIRSIFTYGAIETTDAKAKAIRPAIESLANIIVTKPDLISRRYLFRFLQDRTLVNTIVSSFKTAFAPQSSNFTKIKNIKFRQGDNSLIVRISFTKSFTIIVPEVKVETKKAAKVKAVAKVEAEAKVATKKAKKETK